MDKIKSIQKGGRVNLGLHVVRYTAGEACRGGDVTGMDASQAARRTRPVEVRFDEWIRSRLLQLARRPSV